MIHLWSFDPGLVSGWCHMSVHDGIIGLFSCGETDHIGIGNLLEDNPAIRAAGKRKELEIAFVIERFVMNTKITPQPWSLETIGLVRYFAARYQIPLHLQGSSEAKTLIKNDVIKRAGLWTPTEGGHANDSIRHALYYLTVKKGLLKECLKP